MNIWKADLQPGLDLISKNDVPIIWRCVRYVGRKQIFGEGRLLILIGQVVYKRDTDVETVRSAYVRALQW